MVRGPSLTEETATSEDGAKGEGAKAGARHSGKLLVRMPATLHDELARAAEAEGVSLNQLITGVLASSVGWRGNGEVPAVRSGQREDGANEQPALSPRLTRAALLANLVVLVLAAGAAIALLVAAYQAGF
jgi:HicB family